MTTPFFNDNSSVLNDLQSSCISISNAQPYNDNIGWSNSPHQSNKSQKKQKQSQLLNIAQKIYYRNCAFSVVCIICIICGIILVHLNIHKIMGTQKIGDIQKHRMQQLDVVCGLINNNVVGVVGYFKYIQETVDTILNKYHQGNLTIPTSAKLDTYANNIQSITDFQQIHYNNQYGSRGGLQCLTDTLTLCHIFTPLSPIISSYNLHPILNKLINNITIYITQQQQQQYTCIRSPITISSSFNNNQQYIHLLLNKSMTILILGDNTMQLFQYDNMHYFGIFTKKYVMVMGVAMGAQELGDIGGIIRDGEIEVKIRLEMPGRNYQIKHTYMKDNDGIVESISYVPTGKYINLTQQFIWNNQYKLVINIKDWTQIQYTFDTQYFIGIIPLFYILYILRIQIQNIKTKTTTLFSRISLLNQLFILAIQQIFTGKKPITSQILQKSQSHKILHKLNQLIDKSVTPIISSAQPQKKKKSFQFIQKCYTMMDRYKQIVGNLMCIKNREILNNRFSIQSFINQICQLENKKIKDYHAKAQELGLLEGFFRFAYMAIIMAPEKYRNFIHEDRTPIPRELVGEFIRMNNQLHEVDILREKIQTGIATNFMLRNASQDSSKQHQQRINNNMSNNMRNNNDMRNSNRQHKVMSENTKNNNNNNNIKNERKIESEKKDESMQKIRIIKKQSPNNNGNKNRNRKKNIHRHQAKLFNNGQLNQFLNLQEASRLNPPQSDQSNGDVIIFSKTQSQGLQDQSNNEDKQLQQQLQHQQQQQQQQQVEFRFQKFNFSGAAAGATNQHSNTQHNQISDTSKFQSQFGTDNKNWAEQETKQQLEIRIRVHMIPKYLAMLKDLDLENQYAKKLQLERQLVNLSEIIQNTRYLIMKHNKNIRAFAK